MNHILDVYLHEHLIGTLTRDSGNLRFQYNEAYINSKEPRAISVSMPVQSLPYQDGPVKSFFSGLLPDDSARYRLARYLGISEKNPFALLEVIGGECAGALSLYPKGSIPEVAKKEDLERLDNKQLHYIFSLLKQRPLLVGSDNIRLSLAGAQDKIAVRVVDHSVMLVKGTTPTSHILKTPIEGIHESVYNEFFCLKLAKLVQIDTPEVEIRWLDTLPYLLIKRYDRLINSKGEVKRLHQEDFCQALGIVPENKYENEGGPSIAKSFNLLENYSARPAADYLAFLQRVIFNYLIGNCEAHGKNYSLLYKGKQPILAPAYDLMCTALYPGLSSNMAMKIGGKYDPEAVFLRHWYRIIPETKAAKKSINNLLTKISLSCHKEALSLKKDLKDQGITSSIFDDICQIINKRAERILKQL